MGASLLLTLGAWHLARTQAEEKTRARFDRQAQHAVDQVVERMTDYVDTLRAAAAMVQVYGLPETEEWRSYARSVDLTTRYPGINGIGIIQHARAVELPELLSQIRRRRSTFQVHPAAERPVYLPITHIEPEAENRAALGLDMMFETHRREAALRSIEHGVVQITGPIALVQDAQKTAGFLLFVPVYSTDIPADVPQPNQWRVQHLIGLVYAPFIVKKLMDGTLARDRRLVDLAIMDGETSLYDEHAQINANVDPDPLYDMRRSVPVYGRDWTITLRSTRAFRATASTQQASWILVGGLLIDGLLLLLFMSLARAESRAQALADAATVELRAQSQTLESSNARLSRFASIAAHDLQEPSRKVVSFLELLARRLGPQLDGKNAVFLEHAVSGARRMQSHVQDVLSISRVNQRQAVESVDLNVLVTTVLADLTVLPGEAKITTADLPIVQANPTNIRLLFENLLSNAVRYRSAAPLCIDLGVETADAEWLFWVADNGIGIEPQYREQVFEMFRRLHDNQTYPGGSGIGLAVCKMVVDTWKGTIELRDGLARADGVGLRVQWRMPRV